MFNVKWIQKSVYRIRKWWYDLFHRIIILFNIKFLYLSDFLINLMINQKLMFSVKSAIEDRVSEFGINKNKN